MDRSSRVSIAFAVVAAVASPQTTAQTPEKNWKQVCTLSTAAPLAMPVFAHVEAESNLQHCDSLALYYGLDHPADWAAALQCGYYQRSHPRPTLADPFYGPGVLTMLYANGLGVPRNYDLAIRFACENTWAAVAEIESRVRRLEQFRDTHVPVTKFDLCDDATSGLMGGACESVRQQFLAVKRRQEFDTISAAWSPQVKKAFTSLDAAEEAFVAASSSNEIDRSGSLREAFSLEEGGRLRDQFLINLRSFAKGDVPPASTSEYQSVDRELNDVYQHIEQSPDSFWQHGTVKPSGIRDTEEVWLKLRNAWVEFALVAYPRLSADAVRAQITRLRLQQLQPLQPK